MSNSIQDDTMNTITNRPAKTYAFDGMICTKPTFSRKRWIWKGTKSGGKSRAATGWEIANECAKQLGCSVDGFISAYHASIYRDHVELN